MWEIEMERERSAVCSVSLPKLLCKSLLSWVGERRPEGGVGEREGAGVRGEGQRVTLCSVPQLIPIWRNSPNVGDRLALRRGLAK